MMYAYDPKERAGGWLRKRKWEAVPDSEVAVVREMARCLREIGARAARAEVMGVATHLHSHRPRSEQDRHRRLAAEQ